MAQNNNPSIVKETAKGILRGAASGGGFVGSVARGVQTSIGVAKGIGSNFVKKSNINTSPSRPHFVKKQPSAPNPPKPNNAKFRKK